MKVEVYIDVLFAVNFFMDLFILWAVSFIFSVETNKKRLIIASLSGAFLYCIVVFCLKYYLYTNLIIFAAIQSVMVLIAFKIKSIKDFLKTSIYTYVSAMVIGGAAYWLYGLKKGGFFSVKLLLAVTILSYLTLKFGIGYIDRFVVKRKNYCKVKAVIESFEIDFTALIDTGNSLDRRIIIVQRDVVENAIKSLTDNRLGSISFKSLGSEKGVLSAIKADYAVINGIKVDNVILGLYDEKLSSGEFNAIVSPEIMGE